MRYNKTISFGKFAVNGKNKVNEIAVEVEYSENGLPRFSVCGYVWNGNHTDIVQGGQCLDTLNEYLKDNEKFQIIYGLWQRNHLNDMRAYANKEQGDAVYKFVSETKCHDYDKICEHLKSIGLYEVDVNGKKCRYGAEWYYHQITDEDMKLIRDILEFS